MLNFRVIGIISAMVLLFSSCKKEIPDGPGTNNETLIVNQWIYEWMDLVYYWNTSLIRNPELSDYPDPEAFFYGLLKLPEDRWSYITSDANRLIGELSGTPVSMGFSPAFVKLQSTGQIIIVVQYVEPGSPAERAGMKRGDIIVSINDQILTEENYRNLYLQSSFKLGFGIPDGTGVVPNGINVNLAEESIVSDPVLLDTIYNFDGVKTGYLVYTGFITGDNGIFAGSLRTVIARFKEENVREVIIDLRYNPGGEITAAQSLASALAPKDKVDEGSTLVKYMYNPDLQNYFVTTEPPNSARLSVKLVPQTVNLNLSRLIVFTSRRSASASELLIMGLEPYMEVNVIGDSTFGKYTGSWFITDTEDPPRHNYAMMPIVFKYANSLNFTDFGSGLPPDPGLYLKENYLDLKQLGDTQDPFLILANELISGKKKGFHSFEHPNFQMLPDPQGTSRYILYERPKQSLKPE